MPYYFPWCRGDRGKSPWKQWLICWWLVSSQQQACWASYMASLCCRTSLVKASAALCCPLGYLPGLDTTIQALPLAAPQCSRPVDRVGRAHKLTSSVHVPAASPEVAGSICSPTACPCPPSSARVLSQGT